jgi:hypothetical protein
MTPAAALAPAAGAPVLDTCGITRQARSDACSGDQDSAAISARYEARGAWLAKVEALTEPFREARANKLDARARALRAQAARGKGEAVSFDETPQWLRQLAQKGHARPGAAGARRGAAWHEARAVGERERFQRARQCGATGRGLRITNKCCGTVHDIPETCGSHLACRPCRGRWVSKFRRKFLRGRARALRKIGSRLRGRGAWSEKLVTLTMPHEGTTIERVAWLVAAWPRFLRWLNARFPAERSQPSRTPGVPQRRPPRASKGGKPRMSRDVQWYRTQEWTPGSDGYGHPHYHIWIVCPRFEAKNDVGHGNEVREAWKKALLDAGVPAGAWSYAATPAEGRLQVDVRRVRGAGTKVAAELMKYMTKDAYLNGDLVSPETYADVYVTHAGKRRCQGSAGFMRDLEERCPHCKCEHPDHDVERIALAGPALAKAVSRARDAPDDDAAERAAIQSEAA